MTPFHLAFKVNDLASTRDFYIDLLGCQEGRSTDTWLDFNFFGHQLSAHFSKDRPELDYCGLVDGISVPIPHFGCLLTPEKFAEVHQRLSATDLKFIIPLQVRYEGQPGEQKTLFVLDPSGNPLEFKSFSNADEQYTA